ncbi:MAG: hypothetical protein AUH78_02195 [Gemmatimonadetes bacterium 13_1_40CM_4_69_8]|nr:MAG: hypothetical protein AUH46_00055 [Gemmatimonadetes bacterium 13_1_40CM_70_15]OLC78683.1 MAG: hypothetical protein AUH78_02195 [Gemmatimonadetes bacterium 13_1_40CM_4_69_8]
MIPAPHAPSAPWRAPWIVLGLLTAVQLGIGAWRAGVMLREGLAAGVRPLGPSPGLGADLLMCGLLALAAWWWLPLHASGADGPRRAAAWALRFLLVAWGLAIAHYAWGLALGRLTPSLTWPVLVFYFVGGAWVRRAPVSAAPTPPPDPALTAPPSPAPRRHPALWLALACYGAQVPHIFFPYHYTDAQQIWACRAFKFAERGALTGVFDCLDPVRPPLHSLILWLGVGDPTFQGRLLPLLLFGAFALLFYQLLRRVAPRLAPWGLVWLLATDHVFKGQVSAYAGVPVMIAIAAAIAVASDDGALVSSRGLGLAMGAVAGATIALIRRDGLPEFLVAMAVLIWTARERRDLRLWLPLAGAAAGYLSWTLRPAALEAPVGFAPTLGVLPPLPQWAPAPVPAPLAMTRLAYGVQGQVFSHYGYGAFAWAWVIVVIWAARSVPRTGTDLARRLGLAGLAGWVGTYAVYAALTFLGQPQMSTLFVIRTGFGRHLVHFFPLCLLHATATAERLLWGRAPPAQRGA